LTATGLAAGATAAGLAPILLATLLVVGGAMVGKEKDQRTGR
jgi:hypothetical protein